MHWYNAPRLCMIQTAGHSSHFLTVCTVANCRQQRAAENRLRHRVLHKKPFFSMSWSFFVLHKCQLHNSLWHANQIRWGHGRSPILLSLVLLPNPQDWNFPTHISTYMRLIIKSAFNLWCNRLTLSLNVHPAGSHTCTMQHYIRFFVPWNDSHYKEPISSED